MRFAGVLADVIGFVLGDIRMLGSGLVWEEIEEVPMDLSEIKVSIVSTDPANGVSVFTLFGGVLTEIAGDEFTLTVPVQWNGDIPHTRQRGVDNVDVILTSVGGGVKIVQVGIVTRKGHFYLTGQVTFVGQAIRTEDGIEFYPTEPAFAYPGADFTKTFQSAAARLTVLFAASELPSTMPEVVWWVNRQAVETPRGRLAGVVKFFNPITGTGSISGNDGVDYFVHFRDLEGPGPFKALAPMTPVTFREKLPREGNGARAELVRSAV